MKRRGSVMVETAFALLTLLLLSLAMVDTGRYLYAANLLAFLAREGARQASLPDIDAAGLEKALRKQAVGLGDGAITVETAKDEQAVKVTVRYRFAPATGALLAREVPVVAEARFPLGR